MNNESREFLFKVLGTPSPSGFEEAVQKLVREYAGKFADDVRTDVHGNVIAARNPSSPLRVMLSGHCDQIGMIVNYIDSEGFIYVQSLGGWDIQMLLGQRLKIWTQTGSIDGIIGRKPIHLLNEDERKKVPKIHELWVDIGAENKEEVEKTVQIGDPVTLVLEYGELLNNRITSPATDDKAGMWVVMEALRRIDASKLKCGVYAVSTVQEEVGLRGAKTSAFGIDPQIGIAVDVTFATDCPTIEKKQNGDVKIGGGPVISKGPNINNRLAAALVDVAKSNEIPYQLSAEGRITGTDANVIQVNAAGVATALISIPNRYMHSPVEVISLDDIDKTADLIARYIESIDPDVSYIP